MRGLRVVLSVVWFLPYLNAYDHQQSEDVVLDDWLQEIARNRQNTYSTDYPGRDDLRYATPGHTDDHDFMTAFLQNQDHNAFTNSDVFEGSDHEEAYMEDHINDFLEQKQGYEMEEDGSDAGNDMDDDGTLTTFQFYGSDDGYLLTDDFNDFPDDDVFALLQTSEDPECELWKKRVSDAQSKVLRRGRVVQGNVNEIEKQIEVYTDDQKRDCRLKCPDVCIPSDAGEKCVEKINGTCVAREPKIEDCSRKMPDPECKAKEAECEGKKRAPAERMMAKKKQLEGSKADLKSQEDELLSIVKDIPQKCKEMRLKK